MGNKNSQDDICFILSLFIPFLVLLFRRSYGTCVLYISDTYRKSSSHPLSRAISTTALSLLSNNNKMTSADIRALMNAVHDAVAMGAVVLTSDAQPETQVQGRSPSSARVVLQVSSPLEGTVPQTWAANLRRSDPALAIPRPGVRGDQYLVAARAPSKASKQPAPVTSTQAWARNLLRRLLNVKSSSQYPRVQRSLTDMPTSGSQENL